MATDTLTQSLHKHAHHLGAQQALCALGLVPPMEKDAFWSGLRAVGSKVVSPLFSGAAKTLGGVSKAVNAPAKSLMGRIGTGIQDTVNSGALGSTIQGQAGRIATLGKGVGGQAAGWGTLGGLIEGSNAMGAATGQGDLGWDWGRAAKGFGSSALMGAGWGLGGNAAKMGLKGGLNAARAGSGTALQRAAGPGFFGGFARGPGMSASTAATTTAKAGPVRYSKYLKRPLNKPGTYVEPVGTPAARSGPLQSPGGSLARGAKGFGASLALGSAGLVGADLASGGAMTGMAYDAFAGGAQPPGQLPTYARPQVYTPAARGLARAAHFGLGRTGLTPYNQAYGPGMYSRYQR